MWGEGALDPGAANDPRDGRRRRGRDRRGGLPTLVGAVLDDPDGTQRTSVMLLTATGAGRPLRQGPPRAVRRVRAVARRARRGSPRSSRSRSTGRRGSGCTRCPPPGSRAFGTPICFENSFPSLTRDFVRDGAEFLVVPVNNASYGTTAASAQHLQMSRMRAVENGRWVVNAAVSGISAFIDPERPRRGASAGCSAPRSCGTRSGPSDVVTPYVRLGGLVPVALARDRRRHGPGAAQAHAASVPLPAPLSPDRRRTLVVLPTYEERDTIEWVLARLLDLPERVDVLVVDDSSPDGTGRARARRWRRTSPGCGCSSVRGSRDSRAPTSTGFRVGWPTDTTCSSRWTPTSRTSPRSSPRLLRRPRRAATWSSGAGTSRAAPSPTGAAPAWRCRKAGNVYARLMLGVPIRDATSGFRVYRREALMELVGRARSTPTATGSRSSS